MNGESTSNVLVISDEKEFARMIAARWQVERNCPEITVVTSDLSQAASEMNHRLVIIGPVRNGIEKLEPVFLRRNQPAMVVICVVENEKEASRLRAEYSQMLVIPRHDGWLATLILISSEALKRTEAVSRAQRAERFAQECQAEATLGRYMLEMRPSINNALTSVLGNADLLLFESANGLSETREQIRTMQAMALRLNEIMQRFSSLAAQMRSLEKDSQAETDLLFQHPAAH